MAAADLLVYLKDTAGQGGHFYRYIICFELLTKVLTFCVHRVLLQAFAGAEPAHETKNSQTKLNVNYYHSTLNK